LGIGETPFPQIKKSERLHPPDSYLPGFLLIGCL
jgi:hypothetical protein